MKLDLAEPSKLLTRPWIFEERILKLPSPKQAMHFLSLIEIVYTLVSCALAAPTDGLTTSAVNVVGLDFEVRQSGKLVFKEAE